jgi:hypothetical protein
MSGLNFIPHMDGTIKSYLWRSPFPVNVTDQLVSHENTGGGINNSDLELAGSVGHNILCQLTNIADVKVQNCYDNTTTVILEMESIGYDSGPSCIFSPPTSIALDILSICTTT